MDADGGISKDSLKTAKNDDGLPHGLPMANALPSHPDRKGDWVNFEIYVMDADGGNQQRLTENRLLTGLPHGHLTVNALASDGMGNFEIYVMDADGGNQQKLTNHPRNGKLNECRWGVLHGLFLLFTFFGCSRGQEVYNVGLAETGRTITAIIE